MVTSHKCRELAGDPDVTAFKPVGIPARSMKYVRVGQDELEAIRLADLERLDRDAAAEHMSVSGPTFGDLIESGRHKVADALFNSKLLLFKRGHKAMQGKRTFECLACGNRFGVPRGTARPAECPACHSKDICRANSDRGRHGRCHGQKYGDSAGAYPRRTRHQRNASPAEAEMPAAQADG